MSTPSPPRPRKKPNFRRPKPRAPTTAESKPDDIISFFNRSNETYTPSVVLAAAARTPSPPAPINLDASDDSGDDGGSLRRRQLRAHRLRETFSKRKTRSPSPAPAPKSPRLSTSPSPRLSLSPSPTLSPFPPPPPPRPTTPPPPPAPQQDPDDDPYFAQLAARATQRLRSPTPAAPAVLEILVTSPLPRTEPLVVRYPYDRKFAQLKEAWCARNGVDPAGVVLLWKGGRVFEWATCRGLGVRVGADGAVAEGEGGRDGRVWVEVVDWEELERRERGEEGREEAGEREEEEKVRVVLKARDVPEVRVAVRPSTTVAEMVGAFRAERGVQGRVVLRFDGEELEEGMTVEELGVEDMDGIDVYVG